MVKAKGEDRNFYQVIISELGVSPFHVMNVVFALMCIIPMLVLCYIIVGKHFIYDLFLDENGIEMATAIFIAFAGLLYAYQLVRALIKRLFMYAEDSRIANNEKKEVLIAVSSYLDEPLKALRAGVSRLVDPACGALKNAGAETAEDWLNTAETIDKFMGEILNFSIAGFIRTGVKREFIDLRDIVQTGVDGMTQLIKKNNLDLQCSFVAGNTKLWGDEKKLLRMTTSLFSSAIKHMPEGGIVKIAVLSDENTVQFYVKNTGPGLLHDHAEKIFGKSEKPDNYSGAKDTIIEFSIIRDIVDLHDGHITVSGKPGKEMEFKIVLPRDLRMRRGTRETGPKTADEFPLTALKIMNIAKMVNQKLKNIINSYKADTDKK